MTFLPGAQVSNNALISLIITISIQYLFRFRELHGALGVTQLLDLDPNAHFFGYFVELKQIILPDGTNPYVPLI